jgi:hypothetical protein
VDTGLSRRPGYGFLVSSVRSAGTAGRRAPAGLVLEGHVGCGADRLDELSFVLQGSVEQQRGDVLAVPVDHGRRAPGIPIGRGNGIAVLVGRRPVLGKQVGELERRVPPASGPSPADAPSDPTSAITRNPYRGMTGQRPVYRRPRMRRCQAHAGTTAPQHREHKVIKMRTPTARPVVDGRRSGGMAREATDEDGSTIRSVIMRSLVSTAVVLPRPTKWRELTSRQRAALIARGAVQVGLLAAALRDLRRRPADQIRGPKVVWVAVSGMNYLGLGPLTYFAFGRRRSSPLGSSSGRRRDNGG